MQLEQVLAVVISIPEEYAPALQLEHVLSVVIPMPDEYVPAVQLKVGTRAGTAARASTDDGHPNKRRKRPGAAARARAVAGHTCAHPLRAGGTVVGPRSGQELLPARVWYQTRTQYTGWIL